LCGGIEPASPDDYRAGPLGPCVRLFEVKRLIKALAATLIAIPMAIGCTHQVSGRATAPPRADEGTLFAGAVPVYGQTVSRNDTSLLAYLRALRRVDVCGLVSRDALGSIGEVIGMGTLVALNECDVMLKMTGTAVPHFITVELVLFDDKAGSGAEADRDSCDRLVPLALDRLPGAQPLRKPEQPFARVGAIAASNCALVTRVADALKRRLSTAPLPVRDAMAVYPVPLAERDPCEVLDVLGDDVDGWDVDQAGPFDCRFTVWRPGFAEAVPVSLKLAPEVVDASTDGSEQRRRDGVELFVKRAYCTVLSFVGPPLKRKLTGGGYAEIPGIEIRPAVVVDGAGSSDCEAIVDVAARAAKLYT
jgi:hypothetical protein